MKAKSVLLSSLFILSACGGGNGGSGVNIPSQPETPFIPQEDTIASSNAKITNMVSNSEYQVALFVSNKLGTDAESVGLGNITGRGATTRGAFIPSHSGELNYDKAAELVEMAEWLNQSDTSAEDIIAEFNKDRNKIKAALKLMDDMYCFVGGDAEETARRILEMRDKKAFDTPLESLKENTEVMNLKDVMFESADKEFSTPDEDFKLIFEVDDNGKIIAIDSFDDGTKETFTRHEEGNRFDSPSEAIHAKMNLLGNNIGLRYSDFGYVEVYQNDNPDTKMFIMPIAGGYQGKKLDINKNDLAQTTTFNGIAILNVGETNTDIEGNRLSLQDNEASLVFDKTSGNQVMTANFDAWYDVKATKYADNTAQIVFANGENISDDKFRFKDGLNNSINSFDTGRVNNDDAQERLSVNFNYYGDSKSDPQESTGIIYYQQKYGYGDNERLDIYMGFGGKRSQ